jgi:lipid-binding SYLF domain-containing protein
LRAGPNPPPRPWTRLGPSVVIVDTGTAKTMTTTTAQAEIYAFFFTQKGLMAGLGLQGTKITKIEK